MKHTRLPIIASLLTVTGLHAGNPVMPDTMIAPEESEWNFRFAPYAWLIAIDGDMGVGPFAAPVDISFSDTLDNLDIAYMFLAEAGYERWTFTADFVYGDFSNDAVGPLGFTRIDYEFTQWVLTATVGYRVIQTEGYAMDVFAGARTTDFDATATAFLPLNFQIQRSPGDTWTDPIIGIRGQADLNERFMLRYNADIGGFGVSSDLVWQTFLGIGYRMTENSNVAIGYRAMGVDYTSDAFSPMDVINHGPVLGFEFRF
jgi:hypothetical protein